MFKPDRTKPPKSFGFENIWGGGAVLFFNKQLLLLIVVLGLHDQRLIELSKSFEFYSKKSDIRL